ncbi:MAG: DUF3500 domain-containing protein [Planctomycetaceae bacterium]
MSQLRATCPDCTSELDRRQFLRGVGGALALGTTAASWPRLPGAYAAPTASSPAETAVLEFFQTLSESQRKAICFPFDHELRNKISANWQITKPTIGDDFYTDSQRSLITKVVQGVTSEEGFERLTRQMDDDDGGIDYFSVAVFGQPGQGKFEFELTGRHLTLRADGDNVDHAAFGGPIVYGHGEEAPSENIYHYQTQQANKVFLALDQPQMKQALLSKAPKETDVQLQGRDGKFAGIRVGDLAEDQVELVEQTLKVLLAPYRQADKDEVFSLLKANGGVKSLHMAFYEEMDLNSDREWDRWRVEGPGFVWHFRGSPHVHAYINIGAAQV